MRLRVVLAALLALLVLAPTGMPSAVAATDESSRLDWLPARGKGTLMGFTVTGRDYNTELAKVRAGAPGFRPAVAREFFKWGTPPEAVVKRAQDRAAVGVERIIVNISGSGTDFSDIASGKHDGWIRSVAAALQRVNRPVLLLWFHEPHAHVTEAPHVPAGTSYLDACREYIKAYRRIVSQWRAVNHITTYVYQSTEYRLSQGDGPDCYPGGDYIDLIGYTGANGHTAQNPWKTPKERLNQARSFIRSTGKRGMVLAGGSAEDPSVGPSRKASWYDSITDAMRSEPAMALYVMVSTTFTDTGSVQWIDTTAKALSSWQRVVQRGYHNPTGTTRPGRPRSVVVRGRKHAARVTWADPPNASRVVVRVRRGTDAPGPRQGRRVCSASLLRNACTGNVRNGRNYTFSIFAYDRSGNRSRRAVRRLWGTVVGTHAPSQIARGDRLRISGTLYRDRRREVGVGGRRVVLQVRKPDSDGTWSGWQRVESTATKSSDQRGKYSFTRRPLRDAKFRVVYRGGRSLQRDRGRTQFVDVRRR